VKRRLGAAISAALALHVVSAHGETPLDTLEQLRAHLESCGGPDLILGEDQEVTLRFAFRANGTVLGTPRATYVKGAENAAMRAALTASARGAIEKCTPLSLTKGFGGAIAGRVYTIRFIGRRVLPLS
jgi:hypothetical protein